jgi:arylsulfatase A-like enzyme
MMDKTWNLNWYEQANRFGGNVGRTTRESRPIWPRVAQAPVGAPNILFIVLDDVGFAQLGCYGGLGGRIQTPNLDKLAARGLRYANWHTPSGSSASRACFLTGRNHHSVGMGTSTELPRGYPGYNGQIPLDTAMIAAVLGENGYNTFAVGKWHLAPEEHLSDSGPFDGWPIGRGFDRYYGFLGGGTDQWHPDLWQDNTRVDPPASPEEGYHLTADLTDRAISYINSQKAATPSKPFFLYLAYGACHSPHQPPREYIERYEGTFDAGWDVVREETLFMQKQLGLVPRDTRLPTRNSGIPAWDSLSEIRKRVFCRQMECFAGFATHVDEHIGRLLDNLQAMGQLDHTLVMVCSDSGASGEGTSEGRAIDARSVNTASETIEEKYKFLDRWGQPGTQPHYATGWAMAGNTPLRWYKEQAFEGGTRVPFIASWNAKKLEGGGIRTQFHHAIDVVPTILDAAGVRMPETVKGYAQKPLEGASMIYSFFNRNAPSTRKQQYFEMLGHRAMWKDGWKAVTFHWTETSGSRFSHEGVTHDNRFPDSEWELYHLETDCSETNNLAAAEPLKLKELTDSWWLEAVRYGVLPLDDQEPERGLAGRSVVTASRTRSAHYSPLHIVRAPLPDIRQTSHSINAEVEIPAGSAEGCIVSNGGPDGGYVLFVKDGKAHYLSSFLGREFYQIDASKPLPTGKRVSLKLEFQKTSDVSGLATLYQDGEPVGQVDVKRTKPAHQDVIDDLGIGGDTAAAVSRDYPPPFTFTGTIKKVEVVVGSDRHLEAKVAKYR